MNKINTDQLIAILGKEKADALFLNKEWIKRQVITMETQEGDSDDDYRILFEAVIDKVPSDSVYAGVYLFYSFLKQPYNIVDLSGFYTDRCPVIDFSKVKNEKLNGIWLNESYCQINLGSFKNIKIGTLRLDHSEVDSLEDLNNDLEEFNACYLKQLKEFKNVNNLKIKKLIIDNATLAFTKLKPAEFNGEIEEIVYSRGINGEYNLFEKVKQMFKNVNVKKFVEE